MNTIVPNSRKCTVGRITLEIEKNFSVKGGRKEKRNPILPLVGHGGLIEWTDAEKKRLNQKKYAQTLHKKSEDSITNESKG